MMKIVAAVLSALVLRTCAAAPTDAADEIALDVAVVPAEASPVNPATITATVTNEGRTEYATAEGCSYWGKGMQMRLLGPGHNEVFLSNPLTRLMCADRTVPFAPGERTSLSVRFEGVVFDTAGHQMLAADGTYTVTVIFYLMGGAHGMDGEELTRSARFTWRSH